MGSPRRCWRRATAARRMRATPSGSSMTTRSCSANLKDRLFDVTVARYAVNWPTRTRPLASGGPTSLAPAPSVAFPSAQSRPAGHQCRAGCAAASGSPAAESAGSQDPNTPSTVPPTNSAPASAPSGRRRPAQGGCDEECVAAADVAQSRRRSSSLQLRTIRLAGCPSGRRCAMACDDVHLGPDRQSRRNRRPHRAHRQAPRPARDRGLFGSRRRRAACARSPTRRI